MDRELWLEIRAAVDQAECLMRREHGPEQRMQVSSRQVVLMYFWQVYHERPMCWACDRGNYGSLFRPRRLLSISQYTRRLKSPRLQWMMQAVHEQLAGGDQATLVSSFDGKLLSVAMHSHDAQATKVRTNSGYARGYRLHAWGREDGRIGIWSVTGAHAGEQTVAQLLCEHLPPMPADAMILGDVRFDSAPLYRAVAARGAVLLTPLQSISQRPKYRRAMGPRLQAVQLWEKHPDVARWLLRPRSEIERIFSQLTSTQGGLHSLPAWVRTLDRVTSWVGVKIIFHNARVLLREARKVAA